MSAPRIARYAGGTPALPGMIFTDKQVFLWVRGGEPRG